MMSNHDAESLKLLFADAALQMESAQIRIELCDQLELQAEVYTDGTTAQATVKLNDGYRLVLRPAVPGFHSSHNWFAWRVLNNPQTGERARFSQIRASVELLYDESGTSELESLISCGVEATNMEQLISKALNKIRTHCGIRLVAIPQLNTTVQNHNTPTNEESA